MTLFLSLLIAVSSFAASLEKDIEAIARTIEVGTNGDPAQISEFDLSAFDYKPQVEDMMSEIKESAESCTFIPVIGAKKVMSELSSFEIFEYGNATGAKILKKLYAQGKVKAALGYYWKADTDNSETCSVERMEIFFTNGQKLTIYFDSTT